MIKPITYLLAFFCITLMQAQKIEVVSGSIEALSGVERYKVDFEYAQNLDVQRYDSEEAFLSSQSAKKEQKKTGSGEEFRKLWFENRTNQYEPTYIQEFNSFNLEDGQVTAAKNITTANHTMLVKTVAINPGYSDLFYVEAGQLEVEVRIYATDNPESTLYGFNTTVRGRTVSDEFERIRTAYGNLGLAVSKHLSRKGLLKK